MIEKKCKKCGRTENLTEHHLLPQCFGKHLKGTVWDTERKITSTLCALCHGRYELIANTLKWDLVEHMGLTFFNATQRFIADSYYTTIKQKALAFFRKNTSSELKNKIRVWFSELLNLNLSKITKKLLKKFTKIKENYLNPDYVSFGAYIIKRADIDVGNFINMWKNDYYNWLYV